MDVFLMLLVIFSFAFAVISHIKIGWALGIALLLALIYIGLRYPHPHRDWPFDRRRTAHMVVLIALGMFVVLLLQAVAGLFAYPPLVVTVNIVVTTGFALLTIAGLLLAAQKRVMRKEMEERYERG